MMIPDYGVLVEAVHDYIFVDDTADEDE